MEDRCFEKVWETTIYETFLRIQKKVGGVICPPDSAKLISDYYDELRKHAKMWDMSPETELLNRHKVAAAMMIAILKAKPIKKVDPMFYVAGQNNQSVVWPFNESLAITTALSILRSYILERVDQAFPESGEAVSRQRFEGVCKEDRDIFAEEIPLPDAERSQWEWELYQIRQDGAYNLFILAHLLDYMEKNARLTYFLKHPDITPTYPNFRDD